VSFFVKKNKLIFREQFVVKVSNSYTEDMQQVPQHHVKFLPNSVGDVFWIHQKIKKYENYANFFILFL